jgi:cytoskeletal protein RodZ
MADNSGNKESTGTTATTVATAGKDKVGDILRKERLTRRITVETIAKDLKLNVGYVKALEASDYDLLPPEPYVRVYIRSLTKYLSLDAEVILKEFYKERGLITDDDAQAQTNKIDVKIQRNDKNQAVIIAAALIVVMAVFAFIANQKGWITQPQDEPTVIERADSSVSALADHDAASQKITDSIEEARQAELQKELKDAATPVAGTTKQLRKLP